MNEFSRFLVAGGTAAGANWLSKILFDTFLGTPPSIVLAYMVGIAVAYLLNRIFVFGSDQLVARELGRFGLVNLASLMLVLGVTLSLSGWLFPALSYTWHAAELAHALGVASPVALSYLAHRHYTFGRRTVKA